MGRVTSLVFTPDGKKLISGSSDSTALAWDVTGLHTTDRLPRKDLSSDNLRVLWTALGEEDAAKAYQAIWTLTAMPNQTVSFLEKQLRPAAPVTAERLAQLIADLEHETFAVRQRAFAELAQLDRLAEPVLRKALAGQPTLELRQRVEQLLARLEGPITAPERLRTVRAIETLEQIGTAAARELLAKLAIGAPAARETQDAQAALDRLARQR
jgi:hypothetical protein